MPDQTLQYVVLLDHRQLHFCFGISNKIEHRELTALINNTFIWMTKKYDYRTRP